jgi:hypothetical protein
LAPRRRTARPHTGRIPSADPRSAPAGDDTAAERRLVETLPPLVRLLARQAAIELAAGGAADADAEEPQ